MTRDWNEWHNFDQLLANKELHTLIQRNYSALAKLFKTDVVSYDPVAQSYHYLAHISLLNSIYENMGEHSMRFADAAYYTITTLLLNHR